MDVIMLAVRLADNNRLVLQNVDYGGWMGAGGGESRTRNQYLGHWRRAAGTAVAAYQPLQMTPTAQVGTIE